MKAGKTDRAVIVPDYELPAALMVPHDDSALRPLLEEIAVLASAKIGVILLSGDPRTSQAFVDAQANPHRFSIVAARFDTPWIRDRAPVALRKAGKVHWVIPRLPVEGRPLDDRLFAAISARPLDPSPLVIAQGNLVAGPRGIALSTTRILSENKIADTVPLNRGAAALGIHHWVVFDPFPEEPTGHADVHARFLRPGLMAVAWHPSDPLLQRCARTIESGVRAAAPRIRCLRVPLARQGSKYASLLNWIQIGRDLLLPRYGMTPEEDLAQARRLLEGEGFRVRPIFAPTIGLGGSLHCLTASVFI